jgi:hypothetical protein
MLDWASRGVTPGWQGWSKAVEISGGVARLRRRWGGGEKKWLTCGFHMSVTGGREEGVAGRRRRIHAKVPWDTRAC